MSEQTTIYKLNNKDQFIAVRGAWNEFAEANGGTELSENNILGRSIWDFITDDTTRMWLDTVFQLARVQGEVVE